MAGRIRDEDIAEVREKARIDDVVSGYVALRNAGGGSLKGLCPFHDEKSPSFHVTPSRGFFHCLAGETRVLTWDGPRPISHLAGGVHRILDGHGTWVDAPFKSYGVQPLLKIIVSRNRQRKELFATSGHRWFIRSGKGLRGVSELTTDQLTPGRTLVTRFPGTRIARTTPSPFGIAHGFTFGDGTLNGTGSMALLCPPKDVAMLKWFPNSHTSHSDGNLLVHHLPRFFKSPPPLDESVRFSRAHKQFARRGWVVQSVEQTDRVEEVFCAEVEGSHAFTLEDNILTGNCFGCQEGGDVINFVMKVDGLGFAEAVESLADKYGVVLRREESGDQAERQRGPSRARLVEAHKVAQEFYAEQLATPDALAARQFLSSRGFDQDAAARFGVGFAPRGGEVLFAHLRARGFSQDDLVASGLVAIGRSPYDRFRGRLLWPIREASGDPVGFGARRIFDDDRIEAKYLNTPETTIYKKSRVLYGLDLARRDIARSSQAVVVEGYTDVMACHLAGVPTAVASCGTAFGEEHTRVLRRFLMDHEEFRGEVIFTFDGDEAGQKAALRTFEGDQNFVSQTYVAVEPHGLDPCDLRLQQGDAAVRELIAKRQPLYRFVLANVVGKYDLDRADGRVDAVREAARLVASVRDQSKVTAFAQEISRMVGEDPNVVLAEVRRAAARGSAPRREQVRSTAPAPPEPERPRRPAVPDLGDPRFQLERETLKLVLQHPGVVGRATAEVGEEDFWHPLSRAVWTLVTAAGGPSAAGPDWVTRLRDAAPAPAVASVVVALAVEPLPTVREPDEAYVATHVHRLRELTAQRRIAQVKAKLQRTNPVEQAADYNRMFGELVALEQHRRRLRDLVVGST